MKGPNSKGRGGDRRAEKGVAGEGRTEEGRVNLALYLPPIAAGLTAS